MSKLLPEATADQNGSPLSVRDTRADLRKAFA
jgi:hypothetical protein